MQSVYHPFITNIFQIKFGFKDIKREGRVRDRQKPEEKYRPEIKDGQTSRQSTTRLDNDVVHFSQLAYTHTERQ